MPDIDQVVGGEIPAAPHLNILPNSQHSFSGLERQNTLKSITNFRKSPWILSRSGDIRHLETIESLLQSGDSLKVVSQLDSPSYDSSLTRYFAVVSVDVSDDDGNEREENTILGIDVSTNGERFVRSLSRGGGGEQTLADSVGNGIVARVGLVLPVTGTLSIIVNGEGAFTVSTKRSSYVFRPTVIKTMWSAINCLLHCIRDEKLQSHVSRVDRFKWTSYYKLPNIASPKESIEEWNRIPDVESRRDDRNYSNLSDGQRDTVSQIRRKLRDIMMKANIDDLTCKYVRDKLEEEMAVDLKEYKQVINEEMLVVMQQMDSPSKIFDHLYLGSEWNASNLEELQQNGVRYILNMTSEIDNFFPGLFRYYNVRIDDLETTDIMRYWGDTFDFIDRAKERNSTVLVHCKMGVSRSASTVIAYAMKEKGWSLEQTLEYVKNCRPCVHPNRGFMEQLRVYEGILHANKVRRDPSFKKRIRRSCSDDTLNRLDVESVAETGPLSAEIVVEQTGDDEPTEDDGTVVKRDRPDNDVIDDEEEIMDDIPYSRSSQAIRPCFFPARVRASMQFSQMPFIPSPAYDRKKSCFAERVVPLDHRPLTRRRSNSLSEATADTKQKRSTLGRQFTVVQPLTLTPPLNEWQQIVSSWTGVDSFETQQSIADPETPTVETPHPLVPTPPPPPAPVITAEIESNTPKIAPNRELKSAMDSMKKSIVNLHKTPWLLNQSCDVQSHVEAVEHLLQSGDSLKVVMKLDSPSYDSSLTRYFAIVSSAVTTSSGSTFDENAILGIDVKSNGTAPLYGESTVARIGLVLPITGSLHIAVNGEGGFTVSSKRTSYMFKPTDVKSIWSAFNCLFHCVDAERLDTDRSRVDRFKWTAFYKSPSVAADPMSVEEWNRIPDVTSAKDNRNYADMSQEKRDTIQQIRKKLRDIMVKTELTTVTTAYVREKLEETMNIDLREYKKVIEAEMLVVMQQINSASKIFSFLYLGSEWNASNLEELHQNKVGCILNVTYEIDNFFPGLFKYYNVRITDEETTDLLKHWANTYDFISQAKKQKLNVLVHCQMGISRSASTVIAFAMKEYGWSLDKALEHVKQRRSCVQPNPGFMKQLFVYEGILSANKLKRLVRCRSCSADDLDQLGAEEDDEMQPPPPKITCESDFIKYASRDTSRDNLAADADHDEESAKGHSERRRSKLLPVLLTCFLSTGRRTSIDTNRPKELAVPSTPNSRLLNLRKASCFPSPSQPAVATSEFRCRSSTWPRTRRAGLERGLSSQNSIQPSAAVQSPNDDWLMFVTPFPQAEDEFDCVDFNFNKSPSNRARPRGSIKRSVTLRF